MVVRTWFLIAMVAAITGLAGCSRGNDKNAEDAMNATGTLTVTVTDSGTGEPVAARVYAFGANDSLCFAKKCERYEAPSFLARIGYAGRHFTVTPGAFEISMPAGDAKIVVERGKEYEPASVTVAVTPGAVQTLTIPLRRWVDMNALGWYSGDLHVHRKLGVMADLMEAEDLNVAQVQTVWGTKKDNDLDNFLDRADQQGTISAGNKRVVAVLSHEIERMQNSAVLIYHTGKTILSVADIEERGMPNMTLIDAARKIGGYVEAEKPWWPESHIDIAIGNADFTQIANNHFTYQSYLPEHSRLRSEFKRDYPEGAAGYAAYVMDLYYAYLNCGFRVVPTAGSASGVLPNPLGYNRVYVHVEGNFSYDNWFASLKKGRCFVTNGPMLFATADGVEPGGTVAVKNGTVTVSCDVRSLVPLERLEIVLDGAVVKMVEPMLTDNAATVVAGVPVKESGWLAVRCFEKRGDTVRFAHTAPVYLDVVGKPFAPKKDAVQYFLEKTDELIVRAETGEYPSDEARDAAMNVYQAARNRYAGLLEKSK